MSRRIAGILITVAVSGVGQMASADVLVYTIPKPGTVRQAQAAAPGGGAGGYTGPIVPEEDLNAAPGAGGPPSAPPPAAPGGRGGSRRQAAAPEMKISLQGRIAISGNAVTLSHPAVTEQLLFAPDLRRMQNLPVNAGPTAAAPTRPDMGEIVRASTIQQEFSKRLGQAGKSPEAILSAGIFAVKKGLPKELVTAADKALEVDARHAVARRVKDLSKQMEENLPENPATERELRGLIGRPEMKVASSKHFLLLYDTSDTLGKGERKTRAQKRLEMLEDAYETFLLFFVAHDVELSVPQERLAAVLFHDRRAYDELSGRLNPAQPGATGFYDRAHNVCVFVDTCASDRFKALETLVKDYEPLAERARRTRSNPDLVRFTKTLGLLVDVEHENSDVEVVDHVATLQLASSSGLLPRSVIVPSWLQEGLATYFEAPADASWSGVGAVNDHRLAAYGALENDRAHSGVDFIVGDQVIDYARTKKDASQGTAQAWALVHYLLEMHPKELVAYIRLLEEMPPDVTLNPTLLVDLFSRAFGPNRQSLEQDWRQYMEALKTDLERLEESVSAKKKA